MRGLPALFRGPAAGGRFDTGELAAAAANADSARDFGTPRGVFNVFYASEQGFEFRSEAGRRVARRDACVEIAEIARIDFARRSMLIEAKQTGTESFRSQPTEPVGRERARILTRETDREKSAPAGRARARTWSYHNSAKASKSLPLAAPGEAMAAIV